MNRSERARSRALATGVMPTLPPPSPPAPSPGPLTVLGVDPGPTSCGWALLHVPRRGPATFGACGKSTPTELFASLTGWNAVATASGGTFAIGCEEPEGAHGGMAGAQAISVSRNLAKTSRLAISPLFLTAGRLGIPIASLTARQVRAALGNVRTDAEVARAVGLMVNGWPKRSNAHTRDAAAVAFVAAQKLMRPT